MIKVQNSVLICSLGRPINLNELVYHFPFLDFSKDMKSVFGKFDCPRASATIFSSGSVNVQGSTCLYEVYEFMNRLRDLLLPRFPGIVLGKILPKNLTSSYQLGGRIDIARCTRENRKICEYAPKLIRCMHVRVPRAAALTRAR